MPTALADEPPVLIPEIVPELVIDPLPLTDSPVLPVMVPLLVTL
jgi:hypothetical protein